MFHDPGRGWIGVDRGAHAVKLAQLRRGRNGLRLTAAAIAPRWRPDGDGAADAQEKCRREVTATRTLAGRCGGSHAAAVASMDLCTLGATADDTPASGEPSCVDGWDAGDAMRYTLSLPESEVDTLCSGLHLAGLQCRVVDGAPLALARALRMAPGAKPDDLVGGIDWGSSTATFLAARNGVAIYARKLSGGGFKAVLRSVAETLGLSEADAERVVLRHGVQSSEAKREEVGRVVADALMAAATPLCEEITKTLSHLSGKLKTRAPERVWVFGVGATPPGLAAWIGERVGALAEPWRPDGIVCDADSEAPLSLFGQAIALSALAWEARQEA